MTAKPVTLTPAQSACLWQLNRFGESAQHAAVKQLENKGLVTFSYKRDRTEWNRVVANLSVATITKAGKDLLEARMPEIIAARQLHIATATAQRAR